MGFVLHELELAFKRTIFLPFWLKSGRIVCGFIFRFREVWKGGQRSAEQELDWNRTTIRKGKCELESGQVKKRQSLGSGKKKGRGAFAQFARRYPSHCQT